MGNALINIRVDEQVKKQITEFAASLGMSTSAFAIAVLLQAVRERRVVLTPDSGPQHKRFDTPTLRQTAKDQTFKD